MAPHIAMITLRPWRSHALGALTVLLGALAAAFVLIAATPGNAQPSPVDAAQSQPEQQDPVSAEQAENLLAILEDDAAREAFIEQLRALVAVQEAGTQDSPVEEVGSQLLGTLATGLEGLVGSITAVVGAVTNVPRFTEWVQQQADNPASRGRWLSLVRDLALSLGVGAAAALILRVLLMSPRRHLEEREHPQIVERLTSLALRTILDLLPVAAFALGAYAMLGAVESSRAVRHIVPGVINAVLLVGGVLVITRAILAPYARSLRLIAMPDAPALYLFRWIRRLSLVVVFGYLVFEIGVPLGLAPRVRDGLLTLVALTVAAMTIFLVLRHRQTGARLIRGGSFSERSDDTGAQVSASDEAKQRKRRSFLSLRNRLADVWHILAIIYVVVAFGVWMQAIEGGFAFMLRASVLSILILVATHYGAIGVRRGLRQLVGGPSASDSGTAEGDGEHKHTLDRIIDIVVLIVATLALLEVWGIGILGFLEGDAGRRVITSLLAAAAVIVVAFVIWEVVRAWVERQLEQVDRSHDSPSQKARMRTLLPLLRNVTLVVLITVASLIALSEIGINIAPLLAGAGVVGLAIGFGAQTLVKDVITGLFNLFENTIAVGDVVNVAGNGGLVEGMTIRTVRLRDLSGNVYTIPFSEVTTVMNMTRDFSYYVFNIGVAYREDVDEVITVIKELGAELQEDPDYKFLILEPIEVLGVDGFADSAVVIKARFKTTPINQWTVGREYNRRMKRRFDELGIEIPFPHMTMYFGEDKDGRAPAGPIRVTATEIADALQHGPGGAADRDRRRPSSPDDADTYRTPKQAGDDVAEITLGHDDT